MCLFDLILEILICIKNSMHLLKMYTGYDVSLIFLEILIVFTKIYALIEHVDTLRCFLIVQ